MLDNIFLILWEIPGTIWTSMLGLVGIFITYLSMKPTRKAKAKILTAKADKSFADNYEMLANTLHTELNELKEKVDKIEEDNTRKEKEIVDLQEEIIYLKLQISNFELFDLDIPASMWLKDKKGTILSVNQEYEDTFLEPLKLEIKDIIGKKEEEFLPSLSVYSKLHDRRILKTRLPISHVETIKGEKFQVLRYLKYSGNNIIGIAGLAIPIK
jgi:hypothetical protein